MRIKRLKISGIGGIKELELAFQDDICVLCGANGVGKTTILNIIVDAFANTHTILKRNRDYISGKYTIEFIDLHEIDVVKTIEIKEFNPANKEYTRGSDDNTPYVMFFSINRMINYIQQESIPKDQTPSKYDIGGNLSSGVSLADFKGWFVNRFLFYDKLNSLNESQKYNFEQATKAFSLMDSRVEFSTVDSSSLDIMLNTNRGLIYFEYLSAGYKTCLYIILGIIKEIEIRFKDKGTKVSDYDGVVLIDEIDLHLHPTWQRNFLDVLKRVFPKAQFIVTTHSPSILQCLTSNQVIPLSIDEDGNSCVKNLELSEYGLQGWSVEDILKNVMEMDGTTSKLYRDTLEKFDEALDERDIDKVKECYAVLKKMLYAKSIMRELIDIQVLGLGINNDKVKSASETE